MPSKTKSRNGKPAADLPVGEWLYKSHGEVLGPVPSSEVVDLMNEGEIDGSTQMTLDEENWRSVQSMPEWHTFLFQARAKIRARRAREEAARVARGRRVRKLINLAILSVALVVVSFSLSYLIIVQRPGWDEQALKAWSNKHVPLLKPRTANMAPGANAAGKNDDRVADINIEQILIDDAPALVAIKTGGRRSPSRRSPGKNSAAAKHVEKQPDGDGVKTIVSGALSNSEITEKVYARSNLNRLYACLRQEIRRNRDLPGTVRLSFTISNAGSVVNVKIDDIRLEDGPLVGCFRRKLASLHFRSYAGERRNVEIPFNWKR